MKLTKAERLEVFQKYDGHCAYCGCDLGGKRWHADHLEPVERVIQYTREKGFHHNGKFHRPENDRLENLMPACAPCNIHKHSFTLEFWRQQLSRGLEVLNRNHKVYRMAKAFGLVQETPKPVVFYFETAKFVAETL